jgi:NTE family protein
MTSDLDRLCLELHRLEWGRDLTQEVLREIAGSSEWLQVGGGETLLEVEQKVDSVYFVLAGRLEGSLFDRIGKVLQQGAFGRGSVVGLFSVLLPHPSHLRVQALEASSVLRVSLEKLLRLTSKHREFQLAVLRLAANLVKQIVMSDRERPKPPVVAILHQGPESKDLTKQIADRLLQVGEAPCVAGDEDRIRSSGEIPYKAIYRDSSVVSPEEIKEILREWATRRRLLIDVRTDHSQENLIRVLNYSDLVLWCLSPTNAASGMRQLAALVGAAKGLRDKVRIVWSLSGDTTNPPYFPELKELAAGDFKTYAGPLTPNRGKLNQQGVERIVRFLRGVQIGLALGGGAARGMAHLGVLKALDEHGIFVDMLAGTSAGAMVGTMYAAGMDPSYSTHCFKKDLLPPWIFRRLPGGGYWYLIYKYRRKQFGPMLRNYLGRLRLEQLTIPMTTVGVDLVEGDVVTRDYGDATDSILESINLPPLSLPIVLEDRALVDGGLLNNVPANALVARGCNFVIAVTVSAKLEKDFMGLRSKRRTGVGRFLTSIQVILRQTMIQSYSMNAVGVQPADFVIAPDVTSFDLAEFSRADEIAAVGESTTNESVRQLKAMLAKLDPQLFA